MPKGLLWKKRLLKQRLFWPKEELKNKNNDNQMKLNLNSGKKCGNFNKK